MDRIVSSLTPFAIRPSIHYLPPNALLTPRVMLSAHLPVYRLLCSLSCLLAALSTVLSAATGFPNPLEDPFYSQPDNISSYALGEVIALRATTSTFIASCTNLAHSYQLKFRSENAEHEPIAAVTTVLVPKKITLSAAAGKASVLSYQNFEDAVSLSCSPSWAWVADSGSKATLLANLEAPIISGWALDQGYYVVLPDHEG